MWTDTKFKKLSSCVADLTCARTMATSAYKDPTFAVEWVSSPVQRSKGSPVVIFPKNWTCDESAYESLWLPLVVMNVAYARSHSPLK